MCGADPLLEPDHSWGEVAASAQDDPDPVTRGQSLLTACVSDGGGGDLQRDELIRFCARHGAGHDAEFGGVDLGEIVDEAASPAVHAVRLRRAARRCWVVETRLPPILRDFGDRVDPVDEVLPIRVEISGAW